MVFPAGCKVDWSLKSNDPTFLTYKLKVVTSEAINA